ncbi:MAG: oligosaccharide flippase family protein [Clostridia bacterium]|nr:oligosaccharide flippase family protein [Clostridia bacterium]
MNTDSVLKRPVRAAVLFFTVSAVCRGAGFLLTPLFTRALPAEEYGALSLFSLWLGIFTVLFTWELSGAGFLRGFQKSRERDRYLSVCMGLSLTVFAVCSVAALLAVRPLSSLTGLSPLRLGLLCLQIGGGIPLGFFGAKSRFYSRSGLFALFSVAVSLLPLGLSLILIRLFSTGANARLVLTAGITALFGTVSAGILFRRGKAFYDREIWRSCLRRALPLLPHYFAYAGITEIGRILLERYYGSAELASFGILFSLGTATSMIGAGILSTFTPWMMRKLSAGKHGLTERMLGVLSAVLCALSLAVALLSPELLSLLAPERYAVDARHIYPISLLPLPAFLLTVQITLLLYHGKQKTVSLLSCVAFAFSALLHFLLVPEFGADAVAILSVLCQWLLMALYGAVCVKTASRVKITGSLQIYSIFVLLTVIFALWQPSAPIRIFASSLLSVLAFGSSLSVRSLLFEKKGPAPA